MFIYTLRASTIKFFGVIALSVIVLFGLMLFVPQYEAAEAMKPTEETVDYTGIRTNEDRIAFIGKFGYQVMSEPLESSEFVVPEEFDRVLAGYNEIQKQQGLDLTKYAKKTAQRYTFKIDNYPGYDGTVYANVITYRGKVIAGDICTADAKGFIHTLPMPSTNT